MNHLLSALLAFVVAVTAACAQQPVEDEDLPLYSQAELDQMLAPVALYPDELLSQLLMAATYPLEIVQAARWSRSHPQMQGQDAVRAAGEQAWDPSVKAMLAFPKILQQMDEDLDWTRSLGDAFLAQQEQVMDTVQALRARAQEAGNLESNEHVEVVEEQQTIVVRHVYPDIAYVPYYDPYVVYGSWWWPAYRPVRWTMWPDYSPYYGYRGFYWGPAVVVGHGFFFSHCDWRYRRLRVVDVPPFYYRRPPPPDYVWRHDRDHRRGVPYRHQRVHDRYADPNDPVPRREPRERRERTDRPERGTLPAATPAEPAVMPDAQQAPQQAAPAADPTARERRREASGDEPSVPQAPRGDRRERSEPAEVPAVAVPAAGFVPPLALEPQPRSTRPDPVGEPQAPRTRAPGAPSPEIRSRGTVEPRATPRPEPRQPRAEPRAPRSEPWSTRSEPRAPRIDSDVEASLRSRPAHARVARAPDFRVNSDTAAASPTASRAPASHQRPAKSAYASAPPRSERAVESRPRRESSHGKERRDSTRSAW